MNIAEIDLLLDRIAETVRTVAGVEAVVLGGSRARGAHNPDSDVDIGIYYNAGSLDLAALEATAAALNDVAGDNLIAAPGEWGAWVNGGGWLTMAGQRVDLILRDLARVENVARECRQGIVTANYQPGHPHAFVSCMYMGELAICRILWDRTGKATALQEEARAYPPALKQALLAFFGFEMDFSCGIAERYVASDDAYYVVAHLVRAVSALNQVIFALNEQYCLNEKRAVKMIEGFAIKPQAYRRRIDEIFALASVDDGAACAQLRVLIGETQTLIA